MAEALRAAGDLRLDVVNLSLFADPYLYYCGNDAEQRAMLAETRSAAARYAQQRGVLIVAVDRQRGRPTCSTRSSTTISPDGPADTALERAGPQQLPGRCRPSCPGAVTVSATGPVGYPGYTMNIAELLQRRAAT